MGDGVLLFVIGNAVIGCYCGLIDETVSRRYNRICSPSFGIPELNFTTHY